MKYIQMAGLTGLLATLAIIGMACSPRPEPTRPTGTPTSSSTPLQTAALQPATPPVETATPARPAATQAIAAASATHTPAPREGGTICVIVPTVEDPRFEMLQQVAASRVEALGYTALKLEHEDDGMKQATLIERCIARQARAIILNHAGDEAGAAAVQKAREAGIPSFLIDRSIAMEGVAVAQITADAYQGAMRLAEHFAQLMGEEGNYVELTGKQADADAHLRSDGFHEVLNGRPNMKMVAQQHANWSEAEGRAVMQAILQTFPDIQGVIAANDAMALGAQAALLAAGRQEVIVVGFDGTDTAIQAIMQGELKASVLYPAAEMAEQAAVQAHEYLQNGRPAHPERQVLEMALLTPENACLFSRFAPTGESGVCPAPAGLRLSTPLGALPGTRP